MDYDKSSIYILFNSSGGTRSVNTINTQSTSQGSAASSNSDNILCTLFVFIKVSSVSNKVFISIYTL